MIEIFFPNDIWQVLYWNNPLGTYIDALIVAIALGLAFSVAVGFLRKYHKELAAKIPGELDDTVLEAIQSINASLYWFIAFLIGAQLLTMTAFIENALFVIGAVWITWHIGKIITRATTFLITTTMRAGYAETHVKSVSGIISTLVSIALWIIVIIFVLSNLGVNVTSLIAGVGVGGIVIAFAIKGILEDLFSSFSLFFDKPFVVGDVIAVDSEKGTVQKIGMKTTRLKSLQTGEELVYPNKYLIENKLNNFHRMEQRRVAFDFGVTYDTSRDHMAAIPDMIKEIIDREDHADFSRSHFREFGDSALIYSNLYYVDDRDYEIYLAAHQNILLAIAEKFEKEGIDMAFPTQTIHVKQ